MPLHNEWCTQLLFVSLCFNWLNGSSHLCCSSYQFFGQTTPAAQRLDGFWDECKCAGNLRILGGKENVQWKQLTVKATTIYLLNVEMWWLGLALTGWWERSWKECGDRTATAKNRRNTKLLTAEYWTCGSAVVRKNVSNWFWHPKTNSVK